MAQSIYPDISREDKLVFVRNMALAFQACWRILFPKERLTEELCAAREGDEIVLSVGPDRHHDLGRPFTTVHD
jgi:hypothetical protein